jgi:FAD/FMN-containing dehydrogenase/Fe-S oxidoreductase
MTSRTANASEFEKRLRTSLRGEVKFDFVTRGMYATDASHYQIIPQCVVAPVDAEDAATATRIAGEFRVPITPRGGGTSLSGQTTWTGMILDFSRHMHHVLEVNPHERWARVQPGAIRDEVNQQLARHRLHFAPDPATGNRAAIGGMIGNNSSGTRSILYGRTLENVLGCDVVLADGTRLSLSAWDRASWQQVIQRGGRLGDICAGVERIVLQHADEIRKRFPKVLRRVSGYNLDEFLRVHESGDLLPWNLSNLVIGSEGTLAVLTEATIRLEPLPQATSLCVVHFHSIQESLQAVVPMLANNPSAIELLDHNVLREAVQNRATRALADFLVGEPKAIQIVEFYGNDREDAHRKGVAFAERMSSLRLGYAWPVRSEPEGIQRVWDVRKLGLGLISNVRGPRKGAEFIEDACVPVEFLPEYISKVTDICHSHGVGLTVYAHASVGVLHVRPMLDLHDPQDVFRMEQIAHEVFPWVVHYGGAFSGEHGDGLIRGEFIPRFFGPIIYGDFREIKRLFDPWGIMNPGKIVDSPPMTTHLRYPQNLGLVENCPPTVFQYREDGNFAEAVEKCNGIGACRKMSSGTMCPSYMATREEQDSTRGRANALRMAIAGHIGENPWASNRMMEVMELCLACKACKSECPNGVDMARLKSDFLHLRHQEVGRSWNAWFVSSMPNMARWIAGPLARPMNYIQNMTATRWLMARLLGFDRRRPLPLFAHESLTQWFRQRPSTASRADPSAARRKVGLFCDTFVDCFEPEVGRKAIELLEGCGFDVRLLSVGCCQRPAISKGVLDQALRDGGTMIQNLVHVSQDLEAILLLEPSCWSAIHDDLPDMLPPESGAEKVAAKVRLIDEFLAREFEMGTIKTRLHSSFRQVLLHGHCHQKALSSMRFSHQLLSHVSGLVVQEISAGCCGMAGSFGYDHFDISTKIGEDRLFPAIRSRPADSVVVASGISCRHQIHDVLGVRAYHLVEVLQTEAPQCTITP